MGGGGKAAKVKKKASSTAYDSEEPTEQEMSVRHVPSVSFYLVHKCSVITCTCKF